LPGASRRFCTTARRPTVFAALEMALARDGSALVADEVRPAGILAAFREVLVSSDGVGDPRSVRDWTRWVSFAIRVHGLAFELTCALTILVDARIKCHTWEDFDDHSVGRYGPGLPALRRPRDRSISMNIWGADGASTLRTRPTSRRSAPRNSVTSRSVRTTSLFVTPNSSA
jgi:hypothetical protein